MKFNLFKKFSKKIILLDIDGVLAPINAIYDKRLNRKVNLDGWGHIVIPYELISLLKVLPNLTHVVWASSWQSHSNAINKTIGIEDFDYIEFKENITEKWSKEEDLLIFCKKNKRRNILLVDDEIPVDSDLYKLKNLTIIKTDSLEGLSEEQRLQVIKWATT